MSNEKHRDSWIDKLDGLGSLPGEVPLDKMAAWDRLHQRNGTKKDQKKTIWYRAAAVACLILATLVLVLPKWQHKAHFSSPGSYVKSQDVKETQSKEKVDVPAILKRQAVKEVIPEEIAVNVKSAPTKITKPALVTEVATIAPPVIKDISHPDTIQEATAAVVAAPKKMRVVHINDIGGDVIGSPYVYPEHKQFKISLSGPTGFASQIVADKPLKINLSPKN